MQSASTAKSNTDSVRTGLTYINNLITGASDNGQTMIIVDGSYMDDSMASALTGFGYTVTKEFFDLGTYPRYKVYFDIR
jgi:hypothetical protein